MVMHGFIVIYYSRDTIIICNVDDCIKVRMLPFSVGKELFYVIFMSGGGNDKN